MIDKKILANQFKKLHCVLEKKSSNRKYEKIREILFTF